MANRTLLLCAALFAIVGCINADLLVWREETQDASKCTDEKGNSCQLCKSSDTKARTVTNHETKIICCCLQFQGQNCTLNQESKEDPCEKGHACTHTGVNAECVKMCSDQDSSIPKKTFPYEKCIVVNDERKMVKPEFKCVDRVIGSNFPIELNGNIYKNRCQMVNAGIIVPGSGDL